MSDQFDGLMGSSGHRDQVLYQDDKMVITEKEISLKLYYFPIGTKRIVKLKKVKSFKVYQPRSFFKMKSWGMGIDFDVWWHCDFQRKWGDRHAIVLDTGEWPSIGITPGSGNRENVAQVQRVLGRLIRQEETGFME
jgi:hypothetical protein